jgi:hypothetical protein
MLLVEEEHVLSSKKWRHPKSFKGADSILALPAPPTTAGD